MTVRKFSLVALVLSVWGVSAIHADDPVQLNKDFRAKTKAPAQPVDQRIASDSIEVDLVSGQKVEFTVRATGAKQGVAIILWDPDGKLIERSSKIVTKNAFGGGIGAKPPIETATPDNIGDFGHNIELKPNQAKIMLKQVPVTGKYMVTIHTSSACDYSFIAKTATGNAKRDIATVEKELKAARQTVADLEAELEKLKKK